MSPVQDVFWSFAPLATSSAVFGLWTCPLYPSGRCKYASYLWTSIVNASGLFIGVWARLWTLMYNQEYDMYYFSSRTDENVGVYVYTATYLLALLGLLVHVPRLKRIRRILETLHEFDATFPSLEVNHSVRKVSLKIVAISFIASAALTGANIYLAVTRMKRIPHASAGLFQLFTVRNLLAAQLLFFASAIGHRFDLVGLQIKATCAGLRKVFGQPDAKPHVGQPDLSASGAAYLELCGMTSEVNKVFGLTACMTYLTFLLETVMSSFSTIDSWGSMSTAVAVIAITVILCNVAFLIWYTCVIASHSDKATSFFDDLIQIRKLNLTPEFQEQVQTLVQKMSGPPVQFAAADFFPLNRRLLASIAAIATTYLVILVQFSSAEQQELRPGLNNSR